MAEDFYRLPPGRQAEKYAMLAREAAKKWAMKDPAVELIKHRENAVFRISADNGASYAMRIHRYGYHSDEELTCELTWMRALDDYGIKTPAAIPTTTGDLFCTAAVAEVPEPRQCDLLEWVDGQPLGSLENGTAGEVAIQEAQCRLIGELAADVHNQASRWKKPEGFTRHHWDVEGLVGENPFWGRFWELPALSGEQRRLMIAARECVHRKLSAFGFSSDRYGLIHGDFLPENLLVTHDGIRLIDFDDSGWGWHLFDLATHLFSFIGNDNFGRLQDAVIEGYRKKRAMPDQYLSMMPVFLMARAFTYLGWVHTRHETQTAHIMTPLIVDGACELAQDFLASQ
ncbi:MAG: phosphotransferase [Desulfobacterales bacterium]